MRSQTPWREPAVITFDGGQLTPATARFMPPAAPVDRCDTRGDRVAFTW
jgi:hypothetical protein